MAKLTINRGSTANDGTGDNLRDGANKVNLNFTEIYTAIGDGTTVDGTIKIQDDSSTEAVISANGEVLRILRAVQYLYRRPLRVCPPEWQPGQETGKLGTIDQSEAYFGYLEWLNRPPRPAKYDSYLDRLSRATKKNKD